MRWTSLAAALWLAVSSCAGPGGAPGSATPGPAPAAASAVAGKAGRMPKVGDVAPEFRVRDQTGKERTLAEFRGRRVVLWFFPKADTPG